MNLNTSCQGFSEDKELATIVAYLAIFTDVAEVLVAIFFFKVLMHRLTWTDDQEGFIHRNFTIKYEQWIYDKLGIGRRKFRGKDLKDLNNVWDFACLWIFMFKSLAIEILQRLADLPYLNIAYTLGDGCNLINARNLTKPTSFYVLFSMAEIYGLFIFVYCILKMKSDIIKTSGKLPANFGFKYLQLKEKEDTQTNSDIKLLSYFSDDVRKLVLLTTGELPLLMLIEYFYVERPLGSDGFFENKLIAVNNILTAAEIVMLILACINIIVDNFNDREHVAQSGA